MRNATTVATRKVQVERDSVSCASLPHKIRQQREEFGEFTVPAKGQRLQLGNDLVAKFRLCIEQDYGIGVIEIWPRKVANTQGLRSEQRP